MNFTQNGDPLTKKKSLEINLANPWITELPFLFTKNKKIFLGLTDEYQQQKYHPVNWPILVKTKLHS